MDVAPVDVAARDGRERVVVDVAVGDMPRRLGGRGRADGRERCRCERGRRRWEPGGVAADRATGRVQDGREGYRIEQVRRLDGCVAAAASDATGRARKRLQGSSCSEVTWPRSLCASVDTTSAAVDIQTSSYTPLVKLSLDLNVANHSGHVRNSLPTFGLPVKGAALGHSNFFTKFLTLIKSLVTSCEVTLIGYV